MPYRRGRWAVGCSALQQRTGAACAAATDSRYGSDAAQATGAIRGWGSSNRTPGCAAQARKLRRRQLDQQFESRRPRARARRAPRRAAYSRARSAPAAAGSCIHRRSHVQVEPLGDRLAQQLDAVPLRRADPHRARPAIRTALELRVELEPIDLVIDAQLRNLARRRSRCSTVSTCPMCSSRRGSLASTTCSSRCASRASCSVDWNAATSSCGNSRMNPTVSASTTGAPPGRRNAAHGRIQRREQLVRDVDIAAGQRIEQRRLAGIGVANQRHRRHRDLGARAAPGVALLPEAPQTLCHRAHARTEQAPVGLELRLAGPAAQTDTALLTLQVSPAAHQAARQMLQLRQLHFQFALEAARAAARRCRGSARCDRARARRSGARDCAAGWARADDRTGSARHARRAPRRRSPGPCRCRRSSVDRAARAVR